MLFDKSVDGADGYFIFLGYFLVRYAVIHEFDNLLLVLYQHVQLRATAIRAPQFFSSAFLTARASLVRLDIRLRSISRLARMRILGFYCSGYSRKCTLLSCYEEQFYVEYRY